MIAVRSALLTLVTVLGAAMMVLSQSPQGALGANASGEAARDVDRPEVWQVMPPGVVPNVNSAEALEAQTGSTPPHVVDQLDMYGDLVYEDATPGMTTDRLDRYFKPAGFEVAEDEGERRYAPGGREDVEIVRDGFGVPHIEGETRDAAMFGQGYASAEDRLFLMDALRRAGRAELSAWLGPASGNLELDADVMAGAPYVEEDLTAQLERLASRGPEGERAVADIEQYIEGVNAYIAEARLDPDKLPAEYVALQLVPEDFVAEDVVANSAFIGGIFGNGGGNEVANYCGLEQLTDDLGSQDARAVFDDLRFSDDPEAPTTTDRRFEYLHDLGSLDPEAVPDLDCDSLEPVSPPTAPSSDTLGRSVIDLVPELGPTADDAALELPWGQVDLRPPDGMSNALLVGRQHTDTGAPIAVMGPQTGYFVPQLFWERSVVAPGFQARGVGIAGAGGYVTIGRGTDYAWSVTSGNGDNVDQFVLALCEPEGGEATAESMGYVHGDACHEIESYEKILVAKPSAGGMPDEQEEFENLVIRKYFERAQHYGHLIARGQLSDGTPIAIATARTTYLDEVASATGFVILNDPDRMGDGVDVFRRAMGEHVGYTYNWLYADRKDIAFQMSCACPQRASGVDPDLPVLGTGEFDWRGQLGMDHLPHDVNPASGLLISWNNKQAPGWRAADNEWGWGPVHRSQLLTERIDMELARGPVSIGQVVDATQLAATTDLRGQEVLPHALALMGEAPPSGIDERMGTLASAIEDWIADGSHRRDHDRDGDYEHATAIAAADAWWEPLYDAIFEEATADARNVLGLRLHDDHVDGSAFQDSLYAHVQKDLRQARGLDVQGAFHRTYCGGGDRDACARALWESFEEAVRRLEEEFDSTEPADWQRQPEDEQIEHSAIGLLSVPPIHWQNRPTFQEIVAFPPATRADDRPDDRATARPAPLPTTGGPVAPALPVLLLAGAASLTAWRRGRRASRIGGPGRT